MKASGLSVEDGQLTSLSSCCYNNHVSQLLLKIIEKDNESCGKKRLHKAQHLYICDQLVFMIVLEEHRCQVIHSSGRGYMYISEIVLNTAELQKATMLKR